MNIYSGVDNLPSGQTDGKLIEGCLCLEGGAFRGVYSSGVCDALMENGINLSACAGVSAGALNAIGYVSGQIGRSGRVNLRFRHDSRYVGPKAIMQNKGLIGFEFLFNELPGILPFNEERFYRPEQKMIAVATNCETGKPEYFEKGKCDIFKAVQASASMPFISAIVNVEGKKCLDGGATVHTPYKWALNQKYRKIIAVRTRDRSYRKPADKNSAMAKMMYHKYPAYLKRLLHSNENFNKECDKLDILGDEGRILVLYPSRPVNDISRIESDMEKLGKLYYLGYHDTLAQMDRIKRYLEID